MASNDMLFACTHCHKRCKFEDLSSSQQLCKACRKQFPLATCTYCRLDFHPIMNPGSKDARPACEHCSRDFKQYGTPSFCSTCNLQSAFTGKKCSRCSHSEKKYGAPVACDHCKLVCAFPKPDDIKKKVDGKTLCLLCTINYKKAQFKKKSQQEKAKGHSKHSSKHEGPTAKRMKLDKSSGSDAIASSSSSSSSLTLLASVGRDPQPLDMLSSNHLLETDKLQNEISILKKQMSHKDQTLLDKDKLICTLKAEARDREKDFRLKQTSLQKSHADMVETLQTEIRALKRQISLSSHKTSSKSSSVVASSSIMNSTLSSS